MANTNAIIANQGPGSYAAKICRAYTGGGYADWYLPSFMELYLIMPQKSVIGGFVTGQYYWTSSEANNNNAWLVSSNSTQTFGPKNTTFCVRAVRSF